MADIINNTENIKNKRILYLELSKDNYMYYLKNGYEISEITEPSFKFFNLKGEQSDIKSDNNFVDGFYKIYDSGHIKLKYKH